MPGIFNILSDLVSPREAHALMLGPAAQKADINALGTQAAAGLSRLSKAPYATGRWYAGGPEGSTAPIFEISDITATRIPAELTETTTLKDVLTHSELYENYPQLKDLPISVSPELAGTGINAAYANDYYGIMINPNVWEAYQKGDRQAMGTVIHELQHAVDDIEGRRGVMYAAQGVLTDEAGRPLDVRLSGTPMALEDYYLQPSEQRAHATQQRLRRAEEGKRQEGSPTVYSARVMTLFMRLNDADQKRFVENLLDTGAAPLDGTIIRTSDLSPSMLKKFKDFIGY